MVLSAPKNAFLPMKEYAAWYNDAVWAFLGGTSIY